MSQVYESSVVGDDYCRLCIGFMDGKSVIDLGEIHGEFFDLSVVELAEVGQELGITGGHEVDGDSLAAETA